MAASPQPTGKPPLQTGVSGNNLPGREQLLMNRPSGGRMLRNEQQPSLDPNPEDPLYHVTCVAASVHLNLDSDPIYGCTDEPLNLGARLDIIAYDSCPYICVATLCSCVAPLGLVFFEYYFSVCCIVCWCGSSQCFNVSGSPMYNCLS